MADREALLQFLSLRYTSPPMRSALFPATLFGLFLPQIVLAYAIPDGDHWRAYALSLINASRQEQTLLPLGIDQELTELSQSHAEDSGTHYDDSSPESRRATYIIHVGSDGRDLIQRVTDQRIAGAEKFGENVGLRYLSRFTDVPASIEESLTHMHELMMAEVPPDDGHKQTILGDYSHVGVGLELNRAAGTEPNTLFLVTDFAKFIDGRTVIIPTVQKKSKEVALDPFANARTAAPPARIQRRIARKTNALSLSQNGFTPDTLIPNLEEVEKVSTMEESDGKEEEKRTTWTERNRTRMMQRKNKRTQSLKDHAEEKREQRLRRLAL